MEKHEEYFEKLASVNKDGDFYRGKVINAFSVLESNINYHLAEYFLSPYESPVELIEVLIDRMTFESKRTAIRVLLDKHAIAKGFVKTKNNTFPHSKLLNQIRELNEERVKFAHFFMMDLSGREVGDRLFGLFEYRDNLNVQWYTKKKYYDLMEKFAIVSVSLDDMMTGLKST